MYVCTYVVRVPMYACVYVCICVYVYLCVHLVGMYVGNVCNDCNVGNVCMYVCMYACMVICLSNTFTRMFSNAPMCGLVEGRHTML